MAHSAKHGGGSNSSHSASHGASHGSSSNASHGAAVHGGDSHGASHGSAHGGGGSSHGAAHGGSSPHGGGSGGDSNILIWILAFVAFCFICDATCTGFKKIVTGENTSSSPVYTQPDVSTKYIVLKRGSAPIRINIPSGYKCDCSSSGKFYHQDQNGPKEIWGDGTFHQGSEHAAYFDISYYNEEIKFVCEFKKL